MPKQKHDTNKNEFEDVISWIRLEGPSKFTIIGVENVGVFEYNYDTNRFELMVRYPTRGRITFDFKNETTISHS